MATKDQVITLHREHPDWTAPQIAAELGCGDPYVRATAQRQKLTLRQGRRGPPPGSRRSNARFTDAEVLRIRSMYSSGLHTQQHIADLYEVGVQSIGRIVRGEAYACVRAAA
jgi:hypothetical protein